VINLLLSLLVILIGGVSSSTGHGSAPSPTPKAGPVLLPRPAHPKAGHPFALLILGLPHGARRVTLLASGASWPARPQKAGAFLAHPVARVEGPWQVDVRFSANGGVHRELAGVLMIRPS
jgi:hypothetical protein